MKQKWIIILILLISLLAFQVFNFDTTHFALTSILGGAAVAGITWASILAFAYSAIDFAVIGNYSYNTSDLTSMVLLIGAWLLAAVMNCMFTYYAEALSLLDHDFGIKAIDPKTLAWLAPLLVTSLVFLTRVLFVGAISVAAEHQLAIQALGGRSLAPPRKGG